MTAVTYSDLPKPGIAVGHWKWLKARGWDMIRPDPCLRLHAGLFCDHLSVIEVTEGGLRFGSDSYATVSIETSRTPLRTSHLRAVKVLYE